MPLRIERDLLGRNGKLWMCFTTEPGRTYQILASTNLIDWTVVDEIGATATLLEYSETQPGQGRFFACREPMTDTRSRAVARALISPRL